ncbi:MAG: trigger factor, partial [Candidatus Omnitrophica bacterium]|nr:trigger factor [Candidatus Omnitrophota bacterium]
NQVRIFFILEDIAKKENIVVEEHEMDARIGTIAQSYNQKKEEMLRYLHEKNLLENIHWDLWEEKIIDHLLGRAAVEEVPAQK